jgi:hypothetical protein
MDAVIQLSQVTKRHVAGGAPALDRVSLTVGSGKAVGVMGLPGAARVHRLVNAAACMRAQGHPDWPDPAMQHGQPFHHRSGLASTPAPLRLQAGQKSLPSAHVMGRDRYRCWARHPCCQKERRSLG